MYQFNVYTYFTIVWMTGSLFCTEYETQSLAENNRDPIVILEKILYAHMFGNRTITSNQKGFNYTKKIEKFPSGSFMRKEYFKGKKAVHAPFPDVLMLMGINKLNVTLDHMQTAIDAFAIICYGNLEDIKQLPPKYVLLSAQTISMMKVAREKLVAIWTVVKGNRHPSKISAKVLELYRPLFKYLSGREMARLNLKDEKILSFIGSHGELTRHQVGVVISAYMKINPRWWLPYFLNTMKNLICGLPINFLRKIPSRVYMQLSSEIFYYIHSCDELQRMFLLTTMSQTQLLGKPFSWTILELSRLGLILTAVKGPDLAAINPDAFGGLTAQVMKEMNPANLKYLNQKQINKMSKSVYNILAKKMLKYERQTDTLNAANKRYIILRTIIMITICVTVS